MNRQILSQMIVGLTLFFVLLACEPLQPAPTPDAIATSVVGTKTAWAKETAVRATLVAEMPAVTLTPTLTETPRPTLTRTPSATPLPTITLTPTKISKVGITGYYVSRGITVPGYVCCAYLVLRFYDDGLVLSGGVMAKSTSEADWTAFKQLNRDAEPSKYVLRGIYSLDGNHIQFTVRNTDSAGEIVMDYAGTYLGDRLILHKYVRTSGEQYDEEYVRLNVQE